MVVRSMGVLLTVGLIFSTAFGQYPFSDNFSSPGTTNTNWPSSNQQPATLLSRSTVGGVYTITNQNIYMGFVYHHFTAPTSTFTASCGITRSSVSIAAGLFLCLTVPVAGYSTGYVARLGYTSEGCTGYIIIARYDGDGTATQIFDARYRHQDAPAAATDTVKICKQGSAFNVFCNGVYLGSFNDATYASGDFGLIVPPSAAATFDDVLFTNQFTAGSFPVTFIDHFSNGNLEYAWTKLGCSYFTEHDSVLDISVPPITYSSCEVQIAPRDTFAARAIVSWRSGDSLPYYGLYLSGPDALDTLLFFGINGHGYGAAYISNTPYFPKNSSGLIHGKAYWEAGMPDTEFYHDTIDVYKKTGSGYFIMKINGMNFDSISVAEFNFQISGAGIFCYGDSSGGQRIFVDYFFIGPDSNATAVVKHDVKRHIAKGIKFTPLTSNYLFDPLGRMVGKKNAYGRINVGALAPGYFITNEGKNGIIIKK
jgi:hypothetical protein